MSRWSVVVLAAGMLLAAVEYLPALDASFNADDYVLLNAARNGPSVFACFANPTQGAFYRPGQSAMMRVLHEWFQGTPRYYHLAGIAVHLLVMVLVAALARELLNASSLASGVNAGWIAVAAGVFFGVLPKQNETVIWIAAMQGAWCTAALLIASIATIRIERHAGWRWMVILVLAFMAALSLKEAAASFPLIAGTLAWRLAPQSLKTRSLWRRAVWTIRRPVVCASFVVLAGYFVARFAVLASIGGYAFTGGRTTAMNVVSGIAINVLRYPLVTVLESASILEWLPSMRTLIVECLSIVGIGAGVRWVLMRRQRNGENAPMVEGGLRRFAGLIVLLLILYGESMLPTIHLSASVTMNAGGRYLYWPSIWLAIAASVCGAAALSRPNRWGIGIALITSYAVCGWYSAFGFQRAGEINDRLIDDYTAYCNQHPGITPVVVASFGAVGGYHGLGGAGLSEAVKYLRKDVPTPNVPPFGLLPFSRRDRMVYSRISDSTIEISIDHKYAMVDAVVWRENEQDIQAVELRSKNCARITSRLFVPRPGTSLLILENEHYRVWP